MRSGCARSFFVGSCTAPTHDTVPPATLDAFRDHGKPRDSLEENVEDARRVLEELERSGISLEAIAEAGVVLSLERCRSGWCRVEGQGYRGWVDASHLWGVYSEERGDDHAADANGIPNLSATLTRDTALR